MATPAERLRGVLPDLVYLDRFRNEGTRTYSRHSGYSEAEDAYRPDAEAGPVSIPTWVVPRDGMNVYQANPDPRLVDRYLPDGAVLFCVHPQVLVHHPDEPYVRRTQAMGSPASDIEALPSSSTRTLYVQGGEHALKVHFPFRISRYHRRMRDEVVEQAVVVSEILEAWATGRDDGFAFLREVLGVTHRNLDPGAPRGENWGYLVRDMRPFPMLPEPRHLIPGFALYGRDRFAPQAPLLVFDLMDGHDPVQWLLNQVLLPVVRHWVAAFRELGLILEPHGQNVLLEADPGGGIRRIVHRDLSVGVDMRRRRALGLPHGRLNQYNRMDDGAFASIAYDKFMGGHFFDALLTPILQAHRGLSAEDFRLPCREAFQALFPDHAAYLPRTVRYFSEERDRFGKPLLRDTGASPSWRP